MSVSGYSIDWHGRCPYCGVTLILDKSQKGKPNNRQMRTKDHIVPQRIGGGVHRNLVYVCIECNEDKHHLTLLEWRVIRLVRGRGPFLAWDRDLPGIIWRAIVNVYQTAGLYQQARCYQYVRDARK